MATSFNFNGQNIILPGAYSTIKSGVKNPPLDLDYGTALIIDTGSGATYGGGAGIDGTLASGKDAIYVFNDIQEMQEYAKGGLWHLLARPLFRPNGNLSGVSRVLFIRAATTVPAEIEYTFTGGGSAGGVLTIQVRDEGIIGNGVEDADDVLRKGYAGVMEAGVDDTDKFILRFYRGTYAGADGDSQGYGETFQHLSAPQLLVSSPEFDTVQEMVDWMGTSAQFNRYFKLSESTVTGAGTVDGDDLTANTGNNLASGGTESYTTPNLQTALDKVADLNISFILADQYGEADDEAQSSDNVLILDHIIEDSKFKPELYIAAGDDEDDWTFSIETAGFFNNDSVTVVHGGVLKASRSILTSSKIEFIAGGVNGFKTWPSIYRAAAFLGREAGLAPQVPTTFKSVSIIDGDVHALDDKEAKIALQSGLMVSRAEDGTFDILKGVNSLQENTFLLNENGTTHSKQIKRIARQLNKEIIVNAKRTLLKNPAGVNRNTLSEQDVKTWLKGYLKRKVAEPTADNLILSYQDIAVTRTGDAYNIDYAFVANSEISFLFFTGFIIEL